MGDENAAFTNRSFISLTESEREYHAESGRFLRISGQSAQCANLRSFPFLRKKGCPQKGSPCGKLSLFGVLNGAAQEVFKQRIQPVPGKRIKHRIDGFGVGPAFAQNVLRNRLPLDGLSRRNKGVHLFLKPVVQQGIDVLLVIVKRIGAALRTFDQSRHGDLVEGHFGKHFLKGGHNQLLGV